MSGPGGEGTLPKDQASPPAELSFLRLREGHERILDLLLRHQEALLDRDIERAKEQLGAFEKELRAHATFEEERLLPLYRRAGPILGGAPEIFQNEHAKMLRFAVRVREMLDGLDPGRSLERQVLEVLDEEWLLKNLMMHHDLREGNLLYPTLDRVTTEEEKRSLLGSTP